MTLSTTSCFSGRRHSMINSGKRRCGSESESDCCWSGKGAASGAGAAGEGVAFSRNTVETGDGIVCKAAGGSASSTVAG
jgi:hypothetical protein